MSDTLLAMLKEFENEMADDSGRTELVPFGDNVGTVAKGYAKQFQSGDIQLQWNLRVTESIPANVGGFVSLRYAAKPRGVKWDDAAHAFLPLTDEAEIVLDKRNWAAGFNLICKVLGLPTPTKEIQSNEFVAAGWASAAEGRSVVFGTGKPNKDGFTSVPAFVNKAGKMVVQLSEPDEERKPGLTRLDLARHEIQKAIAKG